MMTFLEHVASDMLSKHGSDLSRLTVVFPNKRASLFLNAHLAALSGGRPLWSPRYLTISELFRQHSNSTVADPIKLVCDLYRSFTVQTGIDETLDHFYGWGQLLLSDFDDIDKNMADADRVFANLRDLHEMDTTDYLTEGQKEAISRFFSTFSSEHNTLLRERFLRLWSHMAAIYHDFNDRLARQGLAYEGSLYREVIESVCNGQSAINNNRLDSLPPNQYVFIGFNVLLPVEQRLFAWLLREGRARFYWDFDDYYLTSDAGQFIARNLAVFPNELDRADKTIYGCFAQPKSITVASASTENIQARYVGKWLSSYYSAPTSQRSFDTAIVLCDETLLPTVIHCLPDGVEHVNVTTGYPLGQAPVAALVNSLFALYTQGFQPSRGRYRLRQVNDLLRHPYIANLSPQVEELHRELNTQRIYYPTAQQLHTDEVTALLFCNLDPHGGNATLLEWMCDVLRTVATRSKTDEVSAPLSTGSPTASDTAFSIQRESLFRAYTLLNRLLSLVVTGDLSVDVITLQRLMTQLMQSTTIPFHGEPVEGLQVMGLLETRNLDFRRVLILSANEGNVPRGISETSFIPYTLRKAYGLTTADHKVALYSYYFHRLLQRAEDITIVYNNSTADGHTGEMSRFVLQLMVEDRHHRIVSKSLQASQAFTPFCPQRVERSKEMQEKLIARFFTAPASSSPSSPILTPTAINRYLRCPLQFYYAYIHDLREPDTTDDDTIDNRLFGNIFHEAARIIYARLMEKSCQILASDIDQLLRQPVQIEMAVDQAIRQELFHLDAGTGVELSGMQLINREVIIHYLRQLLTIDRRLAPFIIEGLETDVGMPFTVRCPSCQTSPPLTTIIGGRIDRLDRIVKDGREQIRVIDYKTGSHVPSPLPSVEAIFDQGQLKNHSDYYLQTFLYSLIVARQYPATAVAPALLFIQHAGADDYSPVLKFGKTDIADVNPHAGLFMSLLTEVIKEMFDPSVPFQPTSDRKRCNNCPYRLLCQG